MSLGEEYLKFSYSIFGRIIEPYTSQFSELRRNLKQAGINLTISEYLSAILLAALLLPVFIVIPLSILFILLQIFGEMTLVIIPVAAVFAWIFLMFLIIILGYIYPSMVIAGKKKGIENTLPFATTYMATMAGSGMPIQETFRIMSKFSQFGDVTKEIDRIVKDIDVFGMDVPTALERASERVPSEKLSELFWEMRECLTTGGNMKILLHEKSKAYMKDYRRSLDKFIEQLAMFVEMYITLVIVGSVFFVVMSAVMTVLGGGSILGILQKLLLIALPLVADMFILLVIFISPVVKKDTGWELSVLSLLTIMIIGYILVS